MIRFRIFFALIITITTTFILTEKIQAQNDDNSQSLITSEELLNQVCDFLKSKESFGVEMDITYDNLLNSGSKVQYSGYQSVVVKKPSFLQSNYIGDQGNRNFYYDGKTFTLFSPDFNVFSTQNAPSTLDELVNDIEEQYGFTVPMSNLFINNPCSVLLKATEKPLFIGSNLVNRKETDHLLIVTDDWDGQLWVSQDDPPLILKAIITYKNLPNSPQYTVLFSNWNFEPSITNETFKFTPNKDTTQIEMLPPSE
ncbi:DUF2092 domain-containing protein [Geminocystis sp. NIES-3709]|uniref:DUF2092 domain-containing protein n=1 Tax=Geminocystis sp. NIES-3709 TaxID=1617448 RepID=UPI0005FC67A7|nr:DUF2092 domain-containing protein [Geminocystis sp. NIES-3709]BAQ65831.1 hypothetical protein GM3709_2596 [Geminocystis sp. NIES-3709]